MAATIMNAMTPVGRRFREQPARIAAPQHQRVAPDMPLTAAVRSPAARRTRAGVRFEAYKRDDGLFDIEAHLTDIKPFDYRAARAASAPAGSRCTTCGSG